MNEKTRKKIRKPEYDYSSVGSYFITLCVKERHYLLWEENSFNKEDFSNEYMNTPDYRLSEIGNEIDKEIKVLNNIYECVKVDNYCIMPDHIHMIISIEGTINPTDEKRPDIPRIMKQFKGKVTKSIGYSLWQKSYNDRIIRDEKEYRDKWNYIDDNPRRWLWKEHG